MPRVARSHKKESHGSGFFSENHPADTSIWDFWLPELLENKVLLF
jgi:hypothetical protein